MNMFGKKSRAFITGMMIGSMVGLLVYTAAANTPEDDIARDYPVHQEAPSNTSEVNGAAVAMDAGLSPHKAISPQPLPHRDYTVFMSDLWDELFQSDFQLDASALFFDSWIADGTGSVIGTDESGNPVGANILFS